VKRTTLVLAGKTKEQLADEMKAAFDRNEIPSIEPGAMAYMLSKQGYLNDRAGHWHFRSASGPGRVGSQLTRLADLRVHRSDRPRDDISYTGR
jgi:hypothetical protein